MAYLAILPSVPVIEGNITMELDPRFFTYIVPPPPSREITYSVDSSWEEHFKNDFPTWEKDFVFDPFPAGGGGGGRPQDGQLWPRGNR